MSYSDILKPRPDVLSENGIEGIIDLANLADKKHRKLESRPPDFLELTYPTAGIRRVVETLGRRFSGDRDVPGLFLFEGLKGSGKSHLLLLAYHLFRNGEAARPWLARHGLNCTLPDNAVVVVNKFTDLPLESIWNLVYRELTGQALGRTVVQPGLNEVREALGNRHLVLILDELEQGIHVIADEAARAQNIAFLQMLSEWANRDNAVTLFTSIYSDEVEPGSTLKRVPSCRVRFEHASDKARIVLHRLFLNYLDVDTTRARSTVESYVSAWQRHGAARTSDLQARLAESYPFSPDLLGVILDRVPARGGFQNVRGALGFLARLVKLTHEKTDLITPAHADLEDREIALRLGDLDSSGELIPRARENLKELQSGPMLAGLAATTILYTLSGSGRERGADREELLRAVMAPGADINDFERSLLTLQRYASYFHMQEGRYYFDREENPSAKVELRSLGKPDSEAKDLIRKLWREDLFRDAQSAVVYSEGESGREALDTLERGRLRFLLSRRRLSPEERRILYHGLDERNQVILLEPKDAQFDALTNRDLLKWAQRVLAADELAATAHDVPRKAEYERLARDDRKSILETIRRAGLIYVRPEAGVAGSADCSFEEEVLATVVTKEEVVQHLSQDIYPIQRLAEHLGEHLETLRGHSVRDVDRDYRTILGYPVPTHAGSVSKAIRQLCGEGRLGVRHPRGDYSGQDPDLTENELMNATLDAPFEERAGRPQRPTLGGIVATPAVPPPVSPGRPSGPVGHGAESQEFVIPPQTNPGALREQLASRLQSIPNAKVSRLQVTIYLEGSAGDLSALPQALRGGLSGPGSLTAEVVITKDGVGGKAEVEQFAERLPVFAGASYQARLTLIVPAQPAPETQRD